MPLLWYSGRVTELWHDRMPGSGRGCIYHDGEASLSIASLSCLDSVEALPVFAHADKGGRDRVMETRFVLVAARTVKGPLPRVAV